MSTSPKTSFFEGDLRPQANGGAREQNEYAEPNPRYEWIDMNLKGSGLIGTHRSEDHINVSLNALQYGNLSGGLLGILSIEELRGR